MKLAAILGAAATLVLSASASAEISGDVVKIGVLNDMSGLYADIGGAGSVEAARMAIADFGGSVNGTAFVSLETGEVLSASTTVKADLDLTFARKPAKAAGTLAVSIKRPAPPPAPAPSPEKN